MRKYAAHGADINQAAAYADTRWAALPQSRAYIYVE